MRSHIYYAQSREHIQRERNKARKLRSTGWWKQKLANGLCYHCGHRFSSAELSMDHLIPIGRGGHSQKGNVVVCCKNCNTSKAAAMPAEYSLSKAQ